MKYLSIFTLISSLFIANYSYAQFGSESSEGVTSFQQDRDSWRRQADDGPQILQTIQDSMGSSGIKNITDAEQIYCYVVDIAPANYEGYTINSTAVKSFCGSLDDELKNVLIANMLGDSENVSTRTEQCAVQPKLMFRFIRGIDYTDVLLSSPCYSFTMFYGGKMKTYNFSKGSAVIDELVTVFSDPELIVPFISPALLDQMVPVGVAQTDDQKKRVNESKASTATAPRRGWETETKEPETPKTGGWNNLNNL